MNNNNRFKTVCIRKYFEFDTPSEGEDMLKDILSEFFCPKNLDVERFFKEQAIEFTKKNQSVTYLVFSKEDLELVGYFTLAVKPITVSTNSPVADKLSNTVKRKIARVSEYNEQNGTYSLSAYLLAQFGKNYTNKANLKITGGELLDLAIQTIKELQYLAGGTVMFLETENVQSLLNFYKEQSGLKQFNIRETISRENNPHTYLQLLKII